MKKLLYAAFIVLLTFTTVNAENLSVDDMATESCKQLKSAMFESCQAVKDDTNHTLTYTLVNDDTTYTSVTNYTDEYFTYTYSGTVDTGEKASGVMVDSLVFWSLIQSKLVLTGHEDVTFTEITNEEQDFSSILNYDTHGVTYTTKTFDINETTENVNSHITGEYADTYKLSLDPSTVVAFIAKLAEVASSTPTTPTEPTTPTTTTTIPEGLKPVVKIIKTEDSKITLRVNVNDATQTYKCYIYKSTTENGTYTSVLPQSVDCSKNNTTTLADQGVTKGAKYYYRAVIDNGNAYVENLNDYTAAITNGNVSVAVSAVASSEANPNTGVNPNLFLILGTGIIAGVVVFTLSRKQSFGL